jgi:serine/threonine-protein kinase
MLVGEHIGPFLVEKELGSGAMGTVYRVRYTKTDQTYALKIIALGLLGNETAQARFEREAKILQQLKHPNIVRLFAVGRFRGTPYFAMEFVEGEALDRILERRDRFTWEQIVALGKQVCAALVHAHEKGIIHRDLKPSNLMILPDGTVKLADFGIAKDVDVTALTGDRNTVGTAAYMSPEQCRGERLTSKSDLYSLGVVFYELLTGRKPFTAESPIDMFMQHVQGTFVRPSRLVMDLPVWLDTLVCQLLEKKPEHRPLDAAMVARALEEVEQKVVSGHSAGVDAVNARRVDRRMQTFVPDETDKQAARTLRDAVRKRKPKKKTRFWYESVWLKALGILLALGGLAGLAWLMLQPPSADVLYAQADRLMKSEEEYGTALARIDGKPGPVRQFLQLYPADPRAGQVRDWELLAEAYQPYRALQSKVHQARNLQKGPKAENKYEGIGFDAVRYEDFGDFPFARKAWEELKGEAERGGNEKYARTAAWRLKKLAEGTGKEPIPDEQQFRRDLVQKKLQEAAEAKTKKRERDADAIYRDVADLYEKPAKDDEDLARAVELAKDELGESKAKKPDPKDKK